MRLAPIALLLLIPAAPGVSFASPWTLPRGYAVFDASFNFQLADSEFFEEGGARPFPLRGQYRAANARVSARFGFTDRLELEASLPLSLVSYTSDPVILLPQEPSDMRPPLDYYQEEIIHLSRTTGGVGDLELSARYRWLLKPIALASEVRVKAPTGYEGPKGTFGSEPDTAEEFLAEVRRFVRPEAIADDVTLGDGQLDLSVTLLGGWAITRDLFLRADLGYNLRLGGAADQLLGGLRVGQLIGDRLLLYVGGRIAKSIEEGKIIGISVAAIDPELPAAQYAGTDNLLLRAPRLERDALDLDAGVIVRVSSEVELNLGYARTLWGRNTAAAHSVTLSAAVSTFVLEEEAEE